MTLVVKSTTFVITEDWAEFARWMARAFDLPIEGRDDEKGWAMLTLGASNLGALSPELIEGANKGRSLVVELEVRSVEEAVERALAAGATVEAEPVQGSTGDWHASITTPQGVFLWLWQGAAAEE